MKLSRFFLLFSIATIFIKIPSFCEYFRISDISLFISSIFIIIAIIKKQVNFIEEKKFIKILLFFIILNLFGSFLSLLIFRDLYNQTIIFNYIRLILCLTIFTEIIIISKKDVLLLQKSMWCFIVSLIIIPISFILYKIGYMEYMMFDPFRFSGLLIDPNYFANFQIIPTLLLLYFIIKDNLNIKYKIILYLGFIFSISTILWSGSRSGMLGLLISILLLLIFFIKFSKTAKLKIAIIVTIVILAFPLGFMFIPKYRQIIKKTEVKQEQQGSPTVKPVITDKLLIQKEVIKIKQESRIETFSNVSNLVAEQDRIDIWKTAIYFVFKNPLGYGPGYNQIINISGNEGEHRVVHNFELELLLQGGILLFILFNYLFINLLIKIYKKSNFKSFNEIHVLVAIIIGLLASGLFLDLIPQKWIWVILAFIILYNRKI